MSTPTWARPAATAAAVALLGGLSACTPSNPAEVVPSPIPTSTIAAPSPEPSPERSHRHVHEHGPIDPDATNEPTDTAYTSAKQTGRDFVETWLDYGYPDGYARDRLDRTKPLITERLFYAELNVLEDAGANADPYWQQLTRSRRRSVVAVDDVLPGYVERRKATVRVRYRTGVVSVDSAGRNEGVPAAASQRTAILSLVMRGGAWKVATFDQVGG